MTLTSEITRTDRPGQYHLAIGETESHAGADEFLWVGSLEDIEQFVHDLSMQIRDLKPLT